MNNRTYDEIVKELAAKKTRDNFLVIKLSYDAIYVLPYKDGMIMLEAFKNAEQLDKEYNPSRIHEVKRGNFEITVMSYAEYERFKIAGLLDITLDEAKILQTPTNLKNQE